MRPNFERPRCGRLFVVLALAGALTIVGARAALAAPPPMSACVGARLPVALAGEQVTIFGPRGTRVWTRNAGDAAHGRPFRAQRSGVFRTVYRGADGVRRHETMVVRCQNRPALTLSNGRAPILRLENAGPGDGDTGCVVVSYAGRSAASVRLYGRTIGTGLDRHMTLTITRGTMPISSSGSCRSFAPDSTNYLGAGKGVVFRGTLRRFADSASEGYADPVPALAELWQPGESHAYKLVVALAAANAAQGLRADQTFTWTANTLGGGVDGTGDTAGASGAGSSDSSSLRDALARMLSELAPTALAVAEASAFPLLLLLLVLAFLIVQDRIDRRDPKLALAPVYPEPDLPFLPPSVRGEAA
jgi:hypothetical protein